MSVLEEPELKEQLSRWNPERFTKIVSLLAGEKSNFRVDFHETSLILGERQYELAGEVSFNLIRSNDGKLANITTEAPGPQIIESPLSSPGTVRVSTGDLEVLRIDVAGKRLDVDVEDKQFVKRMIKLRNEISPKKPSKELDESKETKKKSNPLGMARTVAETCKKLGITLTVSYKGRRIATIGADAHSTALQMITKTRAIAINSPLAAIEMMI